MSFQRIGIGNAHLELKSTIEEQCQQRANQIHYVHLSQIALNEYAMCIDAKDVPSIEEIGQLLKQSNALETKGVVVIKSASHLATQLPDLLKEIYQETGQDFEGNASRTLRKKVYKSAQNVFHTTQLHHAITLPQHNEAAYHNAYPKIMVFYCKTPASKGEGATPLTKNNDLVRKLPKAILEQLQEKGLLYRRYLPSQTSPVTQAFHGFIQELALGTAFPYASWQQVFDCENRHVLEDKLKNLGAKQYTWMPNGGICYEVHKLPDDPVWLSPLGFYRFGSDTESGLRSLLEQMFSLIQQSCPHLDSDEIKQEVDQLSQLNLTSGWPCDLVGVPISEGILQQVRRTMIDQTVRFDWEEGMIMILNNHLVMHGREQFRTPEREIHVVFA
ncbi:TauD/TfdA family dioxygenase [Algicola sagamiensis]|uniref:TauD/TfdA family dioxygenase n=1 Tax=Algicola sagamiensis TaxID=163869 RepID=UPI000377FB2F|nr:TauD/TfdA family dioxygenase [Algicola sagamiensis]